MFHIKISCLLKITSKLPVNNNWFQNHHFFYQQIFRANSLGINLIQHHQSVFTVAPPQS